LIDVTHNVLDVLVGHSRAVTGIDKCNHDRSGVQFHIGKSHDDIFVQINYSTQGFVETGWRGLQTFIITPLSEGNAKHSEVTLEHNHCDGAIMGNQVSIFALHGIAPYQIEPANDQHNSFVERV
jgi:hypothetical protein